MLGIIKKVFGTAQSRKIKKYLKIVKQINQIEKKYQNFSEEEIIANTELFKKRLQEGESLDSLLPEAYATVKNICRKLCGTEIHVSGYNQKWDMIPYDVQILGAIAMYYGAISEMQTGEGKTLTASMPLYLNALTGKATHLVTVNDYLAKRDCEWIGTIFRKLSLSVAALTNDIPPHQRKEIYANDIVYGTASEFGFDYLRDNSMATHKEEQCQRKPFFAIVDEIDSILIDEARTPLIISGPSPVSRHKYDELKGTVAVLVKEQRDLCNKLASEARKELDSLGLLSEEPKKLSKEENEKKIKAFNKLWLVSKGTPRNKILKRIKENPDFRAELDQIETFYYSEQNKEAKKEALAGLFIIIDERNSDFELTDKGIAAWEGNDSQEESNNDFILLDLGHEYALIDENPDLSEEQKIEKKNQIREEDANRKERAHNLRQLFRAHLLMEKDVDYIVQNEQIVIIDENTGRPQPGRRFSDGLHQAIEAKESVAIQRETQTYATITLQNYFRMYEKLAGMTGTAITEAGEFKEIYKLDVLEIPTHTPCIRKDHNDLIYMTEREKYHSIVNTISEKHKKGLPILVGTSSVEESEKLSRILRQQKLIHTVLNAKNHEREAQIIAEAGTKGAVTIATNMAGRGTDIKITPETREAGGLQVIGTTRHQSRRIDRQLRGRSGRLGDPGASMFFVSFEDSLMRLFASPRLTSMLQRFRPPEGEAISASVLNKSIETAQKRIEQRNYNIRKHTLEYDDVMNKQRQEVYAFRNELLHSQDPIQIAKEILEDLIFEKCDFLTQTKRISTSSKEELKQWLMSIFPITANTEDLNKHALDKLPDYIATQIKNLFDHKLAHQLEIIQQYEKSDEETAKEKGLSILKEIIRNVAISKIDDLWQKHLLDIDHLKSDVNLRVVGQKDPLMEFKQEAFNLFGNFSQNLKEALATDLFKFQMIKPQDRKIENSLLDLQMHTQKSFVPQPGMTDIEETTTQDKPQPIVKETKINRNDDCPCGSGKKYKKCCAKNN